MGFGEIFLIIIMALIVLGPKQLPPLLKKLGQLFHRVNNVSSTIKNDVLNEINLQENEEKAKLADATYENKNQSKGKVDE